MRIQWTCLALLTVAGCNHSSDTAPPRKESEQSALPGPAGPVMPEAKSPIIAELEKEGANRPKTQVSVEKLIAAVEGAGIKLQDQKQVLAVALNAHYCYVVDTAEGLGMSVCEYDDAAKAQAGKAMSLVKFKTILHRTLEVNDLTLLTLNEQVQAPLVVQQKERVLEIFRKLSAK